MVSCNTQYLQAVVQYLSVLEEEKLESKRSTESRHIALSAPSALNTPGVKGSRGTSTGVLLALARTPGFTHAPGGS